jgi:hypothetical protein
MAQPNITNGTVAGYFGSYPDVDRHSCRLLGPTALVGIFAMLYRILPRHPMDSSLDRARAHGNPCHSFLGV